LFVSFTIIESTRNDLGDKGIALNITSINEHIQGIERHIIMVKEKVRAIYKN